MKSQLNRVLPLFSLIFLASLAQASSKLDSKIECSGKSGGQAISILANPKTQTLEITTYPKHHAGGLNSGAIQVASYPITEVRPMFPVYSLTAEKDLSPVDGRDVKLTLSISAELWMAGQTNPGTLTTETSGKLGLKTTRLKVKCSKE